MSDLSANHSFGHLLVGIDLSVPTLDGSCRRYINLDNAASTPPLVSVQKTVNRFMEVYSSVHRGTGYKSQVSTHAYEAARRVVLEFVGANPDTHVCIFGKNTTEALNKLARRFPYTDERNVVLTSGMEHHSNDLPWRRAARTVHIRLTPDGYLDEADFDDKLQHYAGQVALVTITGASNVTGYLNPVHRLAEKSHAAGAQIAVDCAQLAPHRPIEVGNLDDPTHLDYVAISGHKLYAPFGTGALIGRREPFEKGDPDMSGGGTVEIVTLEDVVWSGPPDREEAGSPNTIGAVALAAAIQQLQEIGMAEVARHEARLTAYALNVLRQIPGVRIYGDPEPDRANERLGVIPFKVENLSHFLVAAILGYEYAIGVRSGCFCAHPYILHLLDVEPEEASRVRARMLRGDKSDMPGLVRLSFGLYNTTEDIDALGEALLAIVNQEYKGEYIQDPASGEFTPPGWNPEFENYFSFGGTTGQKELI
jgi:selenocysteine lyase/cysteine desulfurase